MIVLLAAAAHQGEEFVLILPAILLAGAFFILRWANQPSEEEAQSTQDQAPVAEDLEEVPPVPDPALR
jgi:hypothetical protein